MKKKVVLSIAGLDPSGGAGVQADMKALTALGVHGTSAVTCVTLQNTKEVKSIHRLPAEVVEGQIDVLYDDMKPDVVKTGMLFDEEIVKCVVKKINQYKMKVVVDPVLVATSGDSLSSKTFKTALVKDLIPKSYFLTPNLQEACELTDLKIKDVDGVKKACEILYEMGAENVLIKGGHLNNSESHDVFFDGKSFNVFSLPRIKGCKAHGSGCTLSSLVAGFLSLDETSLDAVWKSKFVLWNMINNGYVPGEGSDVLNHSSNVVDELPSSFLSGERFKIWLELKKGIEEVIKILPRNFIPEVGMNMGFALPGAKSFEDVCAVNGRVVKTKNKVVRCGCVDFGVSKHVASIVLAAVGFSPEIRCAMNLKYSDDAVEKCEKVGLKIGSFDRLKEPKNVKSTMEWGTSFVVKNLGFVPDVIFDSGGVGKEPMIRILGYNPNDVIKKLREILTN